jgi:hypothetical protein
MDYKLLLNQENVPIIREELREYHIKTSTSCLHVFQKTLYPSIITPVFIKLTPVFISQQINFSVKAALTSAEQTYDLSLSLSTLRTRLAYLLPV